MKKEIEKRYTIEITIKNIEVDSEHYNFDFSVKVNGRNKLFESYESDYSNGMSPSEWKEELKNGYALQLVLENYFDKF